MSDEATITLSTATAQVPAERPFRPKPKQPGEPGFLEEKLARLNRVLPFSDEAEKGVLSGVLHDPQGRLLDLAGSLPVEAFYHPGNQMIYRLACELITQSKPLDITTLTLALRERGELDKVGGAGGISQIYSFIPVAAHYQFYLDVVRGKFLLRRLIDVCSDGITSAYEHASSTDEESVEAVLSGVWEQVFAVMQDAQGFGTSRGEPQSMNRAVAAVVDQLEANMKAIAEGREVSGLRLGLPPIDREFHGCQPGTRIVVGAHSSVGKTSLMMQMARSLCLDQQQPGLIFSLDGLKETLARRALSAVAQVAVTDIHSGHGFFHDKGRRKYDDLSIAVHKVSGMKLWIVDDPGLTFPQMIAIARRWIIQKKITWIAWDYFQNITMGHKGYNGNRTAELDAVSKAWKAFLMQTKVMGIMLAQLNWEKDKSGRMTQLNMKDCKALFDDAENVLMLSREERPLEQVLEEEVPKGFVGDADAEKARRQPLVLGEHLVKCDIAKNKDGRSGFPVFLRHHASVMTWYSLTRSQHLRDSGFNKTNREAAHEHVSPDDEGSGSF